MSSTFEHRLNQITDKLLSQELLTNVGLGNEIGFYIFDYPPKHELRVRRFIPIIEDQIKKRRPDLRFIHINLFSLIIDYLKERNLLDRSYQKQKSEGDEALLRALKGPLNVNEKVAPYFVQKVRPEEQDLVLMSGIGSAWPLVRTHSLLNNLQNHMQNKPLVIFYPGIYDGLELRLFGRVSDKNYYRAFRLVPPPI